MGFQEILAEQGYVPAGMPPKQIDPSTGEAQNVGAGAINRIAFTIRKLKQQQEEQQAAKQKQMMNMFDMYKTLREAGYDSKSANEAVMKNQMPVDMPGLATKEEKEKAETVKTEAETKKIEKETQLMTPNKSQLENRILDKIDKGVDLTVGEQKVYDDVIRKRKPADETDVFSETGGAKENAKSPYKEYPDAFQENGVWKVVRNGKKYHIEE